MKTYLKTLLSVFTALLFFVVGGVAFAGEPAVVSPNDLYAGMTYGDWSAVWWQYVIQTPNAGTTLFSDDSSGPYDCSQGQTPTSAPVFFLVGGGMQYKAATRTCTVPKGKAIFFPIINSECSTLEPAPFYGANEFALRTCVSTYTNAVNSLRVTVDGVPLGNLRLARAQSPVYTFTSVDSAGILGVQGTGSSVSDGYWVLLAPLSPGKHTIHFEAAAPVTPAGPNYQNVTYKLTVH